MRTVLILSGDFCALFPLKKESTQPSFDSQLSFFLFRTLIVLRTGVDHLEAVCPDVYAPKIYRRQHAGICGILRVISMAYPQRDPPVLLRRAIHHTVKPETITARVCAA